MQLCAQALCLEEMLSVPVPEGALFYGKVRRRTAVAFDEELRALTRAVAAATRALLAAGRTPPPVYERKRCDTCSLLELCRPKRLARPGPVAAWLRRADRGGRAPERAAHRDDPVRRHLNTLYVTTQGAYLSKDGANVVVAVEGAERARVPIHTLGGLVGFGRVALSPPLLGFCAEEGVAVTFLSEHGKFLARVEGPVSGNVLLRREQYRRTDDPDALRRDRPEPGDRQGAQPARRAPPRPARPRRAHGRRRRRPRSRRPSGASPTSRAAPSGRRAADALRGLEGEAANVYFGVFDALIRAQNEDFRFAGRSRRPPLDPVNALLSFLYALLVHDCARRSRPSASTRRSASCTATGRAGRASRSTSWRSSAPSSPTAWRCR